MQAYIGTKVILAEEMDERTFQTDIKKNETKEMIPRRRGYHVVYSNPGSEYHSWSPADVFEIAYRPVSDGEEELIMQGKCNEPGPDNG